MRIADARTGTVPRWTSRLLLACCAALLCACNGKAAESPAARPLPGERSFVLPGRVTQVTDGDTAEVQMDSGLITIRFHGIDAPEVRQPFGRQARQALEQLIRGRRVEIRPVEQDRYERMVAVVYSDGININAKLIEQGHAWAYRQYLGHTTEDARYCELEAAARAGRRGLWSQPTERWVPPWIYRERARSLPGVAVPAPDYRRETALSCQEAAGKRPPVSSSGSPAAPRTMQAAPPDPACTIKGNINGNGEKIYHLPGSPDYASTGVNTARGERWFCSEEQARAAGWRARR